MQTLVFEFLNDHCMASERVNEKVMDILVFMLKIVSLKLFQRLRANLSMIWMECYDLNPLGLEFFLVVLSDVYLMFID